MKSVDGLQFFQKLEDSAATSYGPCWNHNFDSLLGAKFVVVTVVL